MNAYGPLYSARMTAIGLSATLLAIAVPCSPRGLGPGSTHNNAAFSGDIRLGRALVLITAAVTDYSGRAVTNLRHTDFTVFDKSGPQPNSLIYLICPSRASSAVSSSGSKALTKLALDSGASAFFPSTKDQAKAALRTIADALRDLYVIGYFPEDFRRDGSWHPVRVTATRQAEAIEVSSELIVRTRLGYYAPSETR